MIILLSALLACGGTDSEAPASTDASVANVEPSKVPPEPFRVPDVSGIPQPVAARVVAMEQVSTPPAPAIEVSRADGETTLAISGIDSCASQEHTLTVTETFSDLKVQLVAKEVSTVSSAAPLCDPQSSMSLTVQADVDRDYTVIRFVDGQGETVVQLVKEAPAAEAPAAEAPAAH